MRPERTSNWGKSSTGGAAARDQPGRRGAHAVESRVAGLEVRVGPVAVRSERYEEAIHAAGGRRAVPEATTPACWPSTRSPGRITTTRGTAAEATARANQDNEVAGNRNRKLLDDYLHAYATYLDVQQTITLAGASTTIRSPARCSGTAT